MIEVIATQIGYYDNRIIQVDQTFVIKAEKDFSHKWMKKLEDVEVKVTQRNAGRKSMASKAQDQDVL